MLKIFLGLNINQLKGLDLINYIYGAVIFCSLSDKENYLTLIKCDGTR